MFTNFTCKYSAFLHTFVFFPSFLVHPVLGFPRVTDDDASSFLAHFYPSQTIHLAQRRCTVRVTHKKQSTLK